MSPRLRYFVITSSVGLLLVLTFLALFYRWVAVRELEQLGKRQHEVLTRTIASSLHPVIAPVLDPPPGMDAQALRERPEVQALYRALIVPLRGMSIVKVKIYNTHGLTVFSPDPAQIGEDQSTNEGVLSALAGEPLSEIIHRESFNASDGIIEHRDLLESYVAFPRPEEGEPAGVFELYSDVTPLLRQISATQRQIVLGVVVVLGLFYGLLVQIYRDTDRKLAREERTRKRYLQEVEQSKHNLERRVAERTRELQGAHTFLQSVIDSVSDAIVVIDRGLRVTSMNAAAQALLDPDADPEHKPFCYELMHGRTMPCEGDDHPCPHLEVLRTREPVVATHRHAAPDGSMRTVEVMISPLHNDRGEVSGLVEVIHDISELVEAVDALRDSEKRFRDVANAAGEYIWETDAEGRYTFVTERVRAVLGYAPEEMLGRKATDFMPAEERARIDAYFAGRAPDSAFSKVEHRSLTRHGREIWQSVSGLPVLDAEGRLAGHRGAGEDVTERKRAELALRKSEARLRTIMDSVVDAIAAIDEHGIIEMCNPATERLFGYTAEELRGRNVACLMPEPYRSEHDGYLERYLRTGEAHIIGVDGRELEGLRRDGSTFPLELAVGEVSVGGERRFVGVMRDLTERKRAEKELRTAREQGFHREKMAAIGQLAAGIIHEVGNPVSAILGAVEEIREHHVTGPCPRVSCPVDAQADCNLQMIAEQAGRLVTITREISDFATPHPDRRELVDLNQIVRGAAKLLRYDARWRDLNLHLALDRSLPAIMAVGDQLTQIIINLLINAADACEGLADRQPAITIRTSLEGDRVRLTVQDNGHGMDQETLDHAFDAFYSTKPPGKGSGLGLSLCHAMVTAHRGECQVESAPGVGTSLHVLLPVRQTDDCEEKPLG